MAEPGGPVRDMGEAADIGGVFDQMARSGGFQSPALSSALEILDSMVRDGGQLRFLSFVGALVSTGLRGVLRDMIGRGWFDVVITTCGALDHDIARHHSEYLEGSFTMDDAELADAGMHRLGNVVVPQSSYGPLIEEKVQELLEAEYASGTRSLSTAQLCGVLGAGLGTDSLLRAARDRGVDVVVPGIMDGAVGSQVWLFAQKHPDFRLDVLADADLLAGRVFGAKSSGALMLGGGISKHHTLWWNQYRGGLDRAVYVTTAQEFDGSLSGAHVREAVSWGKVRKDARQVTVHAEATTVVPFLHAALVSRQTTK